MWQNSWLNWWHFEWGIDIGWDIYATGYKDAADIIVDHLPLQRGTLDTVVYPVLFLYRHFLELRLKGLVRDGRELLDHDGGTPSGHGLETLWRELRPMLEELWPENEQTDLDALEDYISQFSRVDPVSEVFRYPQKKRDGTWSLEHMTHTNVRRVAELMDNIANLLDGIKEAMAHYLDYKRAQRLE